MGSLNTKAALVQDENHYVVGDVGEHETNTGGLFPHLLTIIEQSGAPGATGIPATWILAGTVIIAFGMCLLFVYCVMR